MALSELLEDLVGYCAAFHRFWPSALGSSAAVQATFKLVGRLSLGTWTGRNGQARAGLNLVAWEVQPMKQIGRRKPKVRPRYGQGGVPFDDELGF